MNRHGITRDNLRSRLEAELAHLESSERPRLLAVLGATGGRDVADQADRSVRELELAQVDLCIHRLRARLVALDEAPQSSTDGFGVGTVVVIDFGGGPETFKVARFPDRGLPTITPDSPLGRALRGARPGQRITFRAPSGETTVTFLAVGDPGEAVA